MLLVRHLAYLSLQAIPYPPPVFISINAKRHAWHYAHSLAVLYASMRTASRFTRAHCARHLRHRYLFSAPALPLLAHLYLPAHMTCWRRTRRSASARRYEVSPFLHTIRRRSHPCRVKARREMPTPHAYARVAPLPPIGCGRTTAWHRRRRREGCIAVAPPR